MTKIQLLNKANIKINEIFIDQIMPECKLPPGNIILFLSDTVLPDNRQGCCVPHQFPQLQPSYRFLYERCFGEWDCCIAIGRDQCDAAISFPAYFAYLVGHEFGHATLCLSDISLHIHSCLILEFISCASGGIVSMEHQVPHEKRFDQFGVFLSSNIHSRDRLSSEIACKLKNKCQDEARLNFLLDLVPRNDLTGLRDELIAVSNPYKEELIALWDKDLREYGQESLVSYIQDYEALFCV
jgi:hypothetical protein